MTVFVCNVRELWSLILKLMIFNQQGNIDWKMASQLFLWNFLWTVQPMLLTLLLIFLYSLFYTITYCSSSLLYLYSLVYQCYNIRCPFNKKSLFSDARGQTIQKSKCLFTNLRDYKIPLKWRKEKLYQDNESEQCIRTWKAFRLNKTRMVYRYIIKNHAKFLLISNF